MAYIHAAGVLRSLWSEARARGHVRDRESLRANRLSFVPTVSAEYSLPPRPAKFTHATARALRKLVVRRAISLNSEVVGTIEAGRRVRVLQRESQLDRILVGPEFVEGVQPLGWVTLQKDGEVFLSIEEPRPLQGLAERSPKRLTRSQEKRESRIYNHGPHRRLCVQPASPAGWRARGLRARAFSCGRCA